MSYLKDREIWLSNVPTGNPPAGYFWKFIQNGKVVVRDSSGNNQMMVATSGSQAITGSLTVTEGITGTVSSASYVEYSNVANKPALVSGSSQITYSGLTGIPSGIVSGSAQIADFGIFATTGSNGFNGSQSITGSLTVTGQVVAQTLNVQQVTSSVVFSSGSNIFGNSLANTQQFTGSVGVTGSLTVAGNINLNGASSFPTTGLLNRTSDSTLYLVSAPTGFVLTDSSLNTMYNVTPTAHNWNISNSLKMKLDSAGNLGLGVTPSAWGSPFVVSQYPYGSYFGGTTTGGTVVGNNNYYNGSSYIYQNSDYATQYQQGSGTHFWRIAPSGTAGQSISFTQAMTLDASGRLGVGISTFPNQNGGSLAGTGIFNGIVRISGVSNRYFTSGNGLELAVGSIYSYNRDTSTYNDLSINDSITVKGAGNVGIGTTSPAHKLVVEGSEAIVSIVDNRSFATGVGGALYLFGNYRSVGDVTVAGYIKGSKVNSTDGDYGFNLIFGTQTYTGGVSEKMRITSGGDVQIGLSANYSPRVLYLGTATNGGTAQGGQALFGGAEASQDTGHESGAASGSNYHRFIYSGAVIGSITQNGTTQVSYNTSSDYRLKTNLNPINNALQKLSELNPLKFNFISEPENEIMGFLAHEVQQVVPNAVHGQKDAIDEEGNPVYQGIDHSKLIPLLTAALQEQQILIESLKSRIEILEQ